MISVFLFDNQTLNASIVASSAVLPVANLLNPQRSKFWRSGLGPSSFLNISLQSVIGIDFIALVDLNLTTAGSIDVTFFSDPAFTVQVGPTYTFAPTVYVNPDAVASPYGSGPYGVGAYGANSIQQQDGVKNITIFKFPQRVSAPYVRVHFTDPVGDYQQLGLLYLGQGLELPIEYGWERKNITRSVSKESIGGQRYTQRREARVQITGVCEGISDELRTRLIIRLDEHLTDKPFIYSIYPEASNRGLTTTLYGRFDSQTVAGRYFNGNSFPFTIIEEL